MSPLKSLFIVLLVLTATLVHGESKIDKVNKVLDMTNALEMGKKINESVNQQLAPMFPKEAAPVFQTLADAMVSEEFNGFITKLYDEFYTEAEIDAMIRFYSSKEGKSILEKMPKVMQESMALGNLYGQLQAQKIMDEMKKKGFEPKAI